MFVCVVGGSWWLRWWWLMDVVVAARAAHGGREMERKVRGKREEERGRLVLPLVFLCKLSLLG